jgi:hypothetical protein
LNNDSDESLCHYSYETTLSGRNILDHVRLRQREEDLPEEEESHYKKPLKPEELIAKLVQ